MLVVTDFEDLPSDLPPAILTIGVFDGVHVGHRAVLHQIVSRARQTDGTALLLTFSPHPQKVIASGEAPPLLQTKEQKAEMLSQAGVDVLVRMPFTRRLSLYPPEQFLEKILFHARVGEVYVGSNFRFGHRRAGSFQLLQTMGEARGIRVGGIEQVKLNGDRVSSTLIRQAVRDGQMEDAARMLGRPYQISGTVVRGQGRGHQLGFPTANLQVHNELVPLTGVYVTVSELSGTQHPSVTNVGHRPTVQSTLPDDRPIVETHLLDGSANLYGRPMRTSFHTRLRPEQKFDSLESLQLQIQKDVRAARAYFKENKP